MNDRPNAEELLDAVRGFLETELIPSLSDARLRFQTLIAANVLGIAGRELRGEEVMLREEWHQLAPLVGVASEPPIRLPDLRDAVRAMNEQLCLAIRSGAFDGERFTEMASLLRQVILAKLAVANPRLPQEITAPPNGGSS